MFSDKSLEERKNESIRIKGKYPDRIPIIVKKDKNAEGSELSISDDKRIS